MDPALFLQHMEGLGVDFYTGVPDSLLAPLCNAIFEAHGTKGCHVVAANEGGAVALAAGHYVATGQPALCYLQNSGLGNAANPIISLLHPKVYGIPCVFVIGWRGRPGTQDEPQHVFQGEITQEMVSLLGLTPFMLEATTSEAELQAMLVQCRPLLEGGQSVAFVASPGTFVGGAAPAYHGPGSLCREAALQTVLSQAGPRDLFVCTTGKASREVFELREAMGHGHDNDFLTVGSMGHAGMIALGIALGKRDRLVWCLDGDGAALMHLGGLLVEGQQSPANLIHVVLNNGGHESVGGLPALGGQGRFQPVAAAAGFSPCMQAHNQEELQACLARLVAADAVQPRFLEILLAQGARKDLGRPTLSPRENLAALRRSLRGESPTPGATNGDRREPTPC